MQSAVYMVFSQLKFTASSPSISIDRQIR
jgi:hypothetical protein